jgi:hypothetical protein
MFTANKYLVDWNPSLLSALYTSNDIITTYRAPLTGLGIKRVGDRPCAYMRSRYRCAGRGLACRVTLAENFRGLRASEPSDRYTESDTVRRAAFDGRW